VNSDGDIIERAREAWQRHRQGAAWADWMLVGEALTLGRELAMREVEAKHPEGRRYNVVMGKWLERHGFDNMDKSDRSRLMECMASREAIEQWRNSLTTTQKLQCNYPKIVLKRWRRATGQIKTKPKKRGKTLREICNELDAENHRLKEKLARLPELDALKQEIVRLKQENARLLKRLCPDDWNGGRALDVVTTLRSQ
jgi:hypothetical protein